MDKIRWGILGTGNIASQFAKGLGFLPEAELIAVGSRARETAEEFGNKFRVPHRHDSYEKLAADPDVDVIYVSTPHPFHKENSILCLEGGKAVLCEKPFAMNAREAEEMISVARKKGVFLMEAMWTRFIPLMRRIVQMVRAGEIGELRILQADFGFRADWQPEGRLLNPALGGGALLDIGVYPVSLASLLLGRPQKITGLAHIGETGVDEQDGLVLSYSKGQLALLSCSIRTTTPNEAALLGTEGRIRLLYQWWRPGRTIVSLPGKEDRTIDLPFDGNGYNYEAAEVMKCLSDGKRESEIMPLDETLAIMQTMDEARRQWGLKYPME